MLTYIRYALATFCIAASVGCLGLWWRSMTFSDAAFAPLFVSQKTMVVAESNVGQVEVVVREVFNRSYWRFLTEESTTAYPPAISHPPRTDQFGSGARGVYFPLWYATLIFALAGVAALRVSRQFSIRSALVATTVIAALIGMAVIL